MEQIEKATGMTSSQLARYGLIAGIFLVTFGIGASYITCILGVAYPCFMSFLALESEDEEDDKQWLTYWVVFGLFQIVDQFAGFILHFIPFYYFLKMAFMVWLFHPSTLGATTIYNRYIREAVKPLDDAARQYEEKLTNLKDAAINKVTGKAE